MELSDGDISRERPNMVKHEVNFSTALLYILIFRADQITALVAAGLICVYFDDYGAKKKYRNCLFFLFQRSPDKSIELAKESGRTSVFQANMVNAGLYIKSMTQFSSFQDYYEVEDGKTMYIFKYSKIFNQDINYFKKGKLTKLGNQFKNLLGIHQLEDVQLDWKKEIFRFEERTS